MKVIHSRGRNNRFLRNGGKGAVKHLPNEAGEPLCGVGRSKYCCYGWIEVEDQLSCPRCFGQLVKTDYSPLLRQQVLDVSKTQDSASTEQKNLPAPGWVYLIKAEYGGLYKIGCTGKLRERLSQIQACSPVQLRLINAMYFSNACEVEKTLHETFTFYRQHGEWFSLPDSAVIWMCSWGGKLPSCPLYPEVLLTDR